VIDVNLTGSFLMSKVFGRLLADGGRGGSIVNISSIAGKMLSPTTAAYAASKAGLQALTACMSGEIARAGVRVNAICPGIIDTSRMDDLGRGEIWQQFVDTRIPLGRAGVGEDIAYIVVYLCSDQGAWITGQSWNVDGGTVVQH
jgi:NAD(P)-dependent dehydrogenase (short-subunit alcohol dehydrogenase family)